ncbi:MAG: hypothetical protein ACYTKD_22050, partial [Planctomycetota bacterium]
MSWFEVDKDGLKQLLEGKDKAFVLRELIQNAWDEPGVTRCDVTLEPIPGRPAARLVVEVRAEAETEQAYWNEKRKKHLAGEHSAGIVSGLEVTETGPPSLRIAVAPGRALGADGVVDGMQITNNRVIGSSGDYTGSGIRLYKTTAGSVADIGKYKVLKAAVPIRGRAVPILFAAYPKWKLKKSQNQ